MKKITEKYIGSYSPFHENEIMGMFIGRTIIGVKIDEKPMPLCGFDEACFRGAEDIALVSEDGYELHMYHEQDCCENVDVEDFCGDPLDLLGEIISIEEVSNSDVIMDSDAAQKEDDSGSFTWTFYKIQTNKGCVTIRWYGESNGYYCEKVQVRIQHDWMIEFLEGVK